MYRISVSVKIRRASGRSISSASGVSAVIGAATSAAADSTLQRWEDLQELLAQRVDLPGAVVDEIEATAREDAQIDGDLVARPQQPEVLAHAGLVGDDVGVLGIGLALTAVAGRGAVNGQTGEVDHRLSAVDEEPDE